MKKGAIGIVETILWIGVGFTGVATVHHLYNEEYPTAVFYALLLLATAIAIFYKPKP